MTYLFTSESVSEGHPDKVCDRISDTILDLALSRDPEARVAVETLATTQLVVIAGEIGSKYAPLTSEEMVAAARRAVQEIGYEQDGFHHEKMEVQCHVHKQSADIAMGVDATQEKEEGAGDQGIMFGYACRETETLMPAPIFYSHAILRSLAEERKSNPTSILEPDSKSQVTLVYENGVPVRADTVVVSTQHKEGASMAEIRDLVHHHIEANLPKGWMPSSDKLYINPTGRFVIGGPDGDTGLTGRKIIVDTYGGRAPHGGGAFSGKDPTKVDRSAAYIARYLAKNIVATGLTDSCIVQLAYAIGVAKPLAIYFHMDEKSKIDEEKLASALLSGEILDLTPHGIRTHLQLNRPIYTPTSSYGHFGRTPEENGAFSWEKLDLVDYLKSVL